MSAIEQVNETSFKLTARGNEFTLTKEGKEWAMYTLNAATKAWHRGRAAPPKMFTSLAAVEAHYKSWKGISGLISEVTQ